MIWAPDYIDELARRTWNAQRVLDDRVTQAGLMTYYRSRPIEWIEDWCYTYDPRRPGLKTMPFMLFQRQKDFVLFLEACRAAGESGLVEKCRGAGMTWLCVCYSVWLWIFHPGTSMGFGSRKVELVDDVGNPDSIFEKIRFTIRLLPHWMLPWGFTPRIHMKFMNLINPYNSATIKGEGGDNIGRGGRSTIYFKDEAAHYEHPEPIEAALGDNTEVQIDISSVNGSANVFYRRRMAGEIWEPSKTMPRGVTWVFIFDWRDDPRRSQEWYDLRRAKYEAEGMLHVFMQEIERDYASSIVGIIIRPEWVKAAIDAHIKLAHLGNWETGEHVAAQDIADGGGDRNACGGRWGSVLKFAQAWAGEAGDAARHALPLCLENGIHELYYDSIGVGTGFKTEVNTMTREGSWPGGIRVMPWTASASPLDPTDHVIQGDNMSPTNEDQYLNLKAQAWFRARSRFIKTHDAVTKGKIYPVDEMISLSSDIPVIHQLGMELSQAVKKTSKTGKTMVDKVADGARSPNLADMVIMAYCPTRELSIFDVI